MKTLLSTIGLSWRLFRGTLDAKYRRSFVGYVWMVAPALAITGGVSLASQSGVIRAGETALPYPLFLFVGILIWQVFVDAVDASHKAFAGARSYLTKVNCPREAIVLAQFYEIVLVAGVRLGLLLVLVTFFSEGGWQATGMLVVCFAGALLLGLGTGAHVMPLTILFADVQHAVRMGLTYGVFLTPAFYAPGGTDLFARLVQYSPLAPLMTSAREVAAGMPMSHPGYLVLVLGFSGVLLAVGMFIIRLSAPILVERMLMEGQ